MKHIYWSSSPLKSEINNHQLIYWTHMAKSRKVHLLLTSNNLPVQPTVESDSMQMCTSALCLCLGHSSFCFPRLWQISPPLRFVSSNTVNLCFSPSLLPAERSSCCQKTPKASFCLISPASVFSIELNKLFPLSSPVPPSIFVLFCLSCFVSLCVDFFFWVWFVTLHSWVRLFLCLRAHEVHGALSALPLSSVFPPLRISVNDLRSKPRWPL